MGEIVERRTYQDVETGKIKEAIAFIPDIKDRKGFVKVFQLFGRKVLEDLNTMNGEAKLLFWLMAKTLELPVQSDMWIPLNYQEVARDLETTERSIYKYIKKLISLGYIEQFKPRHATFRIKPNLLYKGVLTEYIKSEEKEKKTNNQKYKPFRL